MEQFETRHPDLTRLHRQVAGCPPPEPVYNWVEHNREVFGDDMSVAEVTRRIMLALAMSEKEI